MRTGQQPLSWVLPLFRTADQLEELLARIHVVSNDLVVSHEIILVDDACPQGTGEVAETIAAVDPRLRVLRLRNNHGQDAALREGLRLSCGEWTMILDADLQDPPEAARQLWASRDSGVDVVFGERTGTYTTSARHLTSRVYRAAIERVGGLPRGACLFALLGRQFVARMHADSRSDVSLLAQIAATEGRFTSIPIRRSPRPTGTSGYSSLARCRKAAGSLWQMFSARYLNRAL